MKEKKTASAKQKPFHRIIAEHHWSASSSAFVSMVQNSFDIFEVELVGSDAAAAAVAPFVNYYRESMFGIVWQR